MRRARGRRRVRGGVVDAWWRLVPIVASGRCVSSVRPRVAAASGPRAAEHAPRSPPNGSPSAVDRQPAAAAGAREPRAASRARRIRSCERARADGDAAAAQATSPPTHRKISAPAARARAPAARGHAAGRRQHGVARRGAKQGAARAAALRLAPQPRRPQKHRLGAADRGREDTQARPGATEDCEYRKPPLNVWGNILVIRP